MDRRDFCQRSAFVATGALAGCAHPGVRIRVWRSSRPGRRSAWPRGRVGACLGLGGRNIPIDKALNPVYGYTLGLDMTRRVLQRAMGDQKKPWEIGKSFDRSTPIGAVHKVAQIGHFSKGAIWLKVDGQLKQNANLNQMILSVAEQISKLSEAFEQFPGDIICSGTPENVGPVVAGDVIEMHIACLPNLSIKIV